MYIGSLLSTSIMTIFHSSQGICWLALVRTSSANRVTPPPLLVHG